MISYVAKNTRFWFKPELKDKVIIKNRITDEKIEIDGNDLLEFFEECKDEFYEHLVTLDDLK